MADGENDDSQEKSFDASESKIRKSREDGDAPQSTEANTLILYIALAVALVLMGGNVVSNMRISLTSLLAYPEEIGGNLLGGEGRTHSAFASARILLEPILAIAPVLLLLVSGILISLIVQRAFTFAPSKLAFKLSRISPISNAKQKYGGQGMVEFGKRLFKLSFIALVGGFVFYLQMAILPGYSAMDVGALMGEMGVMARSLLFAVICALALLTLFDLPYSYFAHLKKLRMTFKEVRDEAKESDGDPQLKQERRNRALAISQSTMIKDVAKADVIIVNPTHYAVALKWDRKQKGVPILLAKGVDELAARIREAAKDHDVPIYSDPPCARSIYAAIDIGDPIKPEHYAAVAASIQFADSLRRDAY